MELLGKDSHTKLADKTNADCSKNCKKQPLSCMHKLDACAFTADVPCSLHDAVILQAAGLCIAMEERPTKQSGVAKSDLLSRQSEGSAVSGKSSSVTPSPPDSISWDLCPFAVQRVRTRKPLINPLFQGPEESHQKYSRDFWKEQPGALEESDPAGNLLIPPRHC